MFTWICDSLPINLVIRRAQHRHHLQGMTALRGPPQKLVVPPRLAFHIQNAPLVAGHRHQTVHRIVGRALFHGQRGERKNNPLHPSRARMKEKTLRLRYSIGSQCNLLQSQQLLPIPQRKCRLPPLHPYCRNPTEALMRESAIDFPATLSCSISRSRVGLFRPKPIVCTGRRRSHSAPNVSASIPPAFSAPSLNNTIAPTADRRSPQPPCFTLSRKCVAAAPGCSIAVLSTQATPRSMRYTHV